MRRVPGLPALSRRATGSKEHSAPIHKAAGIRAA